MYAGDKPGGMWLSPTSHLGTGGVLYPCVWPSVSPPWYYSELHGCCGQTERQCLELVCLTLYMKTQDISWTVPVLVYGSRHPCTIIEVTHPPCWREVLMVSSVSIFFFFFFKADVMSVTGRGSCGD